MQSGLECFAFVKSALWSQVGRTLELANGSKERTKQVYSEICLGQPLQG